MKTNRALMGRVLGARGISGKWCALALLLAAMSCGGMSGDCDDFDFLEITPGDGNPCADGVLGDMLDDYIDGSAVAVIMTNRSTDYVHLIGWRETPDLCNRVDDRGGTRGIFIPSDWISYRVSAYKNGELVDEIVCEVTGDALEVVYTDTFGLQCVDFGG